ncbi:MAG: NAD(P)/FAD-dependent oxidoreductase [Candidatus Acidiferrales bacterium]
MNLDLQHELSLDLSGVRRHPLMYVWLDAAMKHVVIVGGGFAGLNCARKLAAHREVRITLIDKHNYTQFQPLLYQVAGGFLSPSNVSFSLRNILSRHANIEVKMAEVASIDLKTRTAITAEGQKYQGDYMVLAAGSQASFFDTRGAAQNSYPLYSLHDAELLRSRILAVLEAADRDASLIAKGALNFVIVGGGPTGAEMAGTLGDLLHRVLRDQYPDLPLNEACIFLIDLGHAVLSTFSPKAQAYAANALAERGVQIRLHTAVKEVASGHVVLDDGTRIPTHTVIWAGGLRASLLSNHIGAQFGEGGRIDVQPDLTVQGLPGVYALGDFANISGEDGKALPQLASVAEQTGKWCARNITADIAGESGKPFDYFDKGIMAMIGRNAAVAEVGGHRYEVQGAVAFAAWIGVHAALLCTTRAKIEAFVEWAWDYFGKIKGDRVLDRFGEESINWNDDEDTTEART